MTPGASRRASCAVAALLQWPHLIGRPNARGEDQRKGGGERWRLPSKPHRPPPREDEKPRRGMRACQLEGDERHRQGGAQSLQRPASAVAHARVAQCQPDQYGGQRAGRHKDVIDGRQARSGVGADDRHQLLFEAVMLVEVHVGVLDSDVGPVQLEKA